MTAPTQGARRTTTEATSAEAAPAEPEAASSGTVKYTGSAGVREITKAQWKSAGIENQNAVEWNAGNEYSLPKSEFSAEALEVLKRDKNLKISG